MKKRTLLLTLLLVYAIGMTAQNLAYEYSYDQAGNRIRRSVVRLSKESTNSNDEKTPLSFTDYLFDGHSMKIYPNPTNGVVRFEMEQSECQIDQYRVFDIKGTQKMKGVCGSNSFDLDLSGQPAGVYLIEFRNKDKVYTSKIIKE